MAEGQDVGSSGAILKKVWRVGVEFFKGDCKRKAIALLCLVVLLCGICAGMFVVLSYIQRDLSTAVANKDIPGFHAAIWRFVGIVVVATPLFAFYRYVKELLALDWRVWLTELILGRYFSNRAYLDLKMQCKLDNPDQRICEDISSFVSNCVDIFSLIASKFLNICAFTGVLWSISPSLVWFLLVYSFLGTFFTVHVFGKKIMNLKYQGLQREADFRYSLVRVRDNAESLAFYRGEGHELSSVRGFLSALVSNARDLIIWDRHLALFSNAYEFSTIIIPFLIIAPRYFAGEVEFGVISQTSYAFNKILSSMSVIILKFDSFSGIAAQTERLDSLISALKQQKEEKIVSESANIRVPMKKSTNKLSISKNAEEYALLSFASPHDGGYITRDEGPGLLISDLSLPAPNLQSTIIHDLSVSLAPGESLLVLGPSGCGKSSLLRAIAGIWNKGSGLIRGPLQGTFFLPQKPYMTLGTLRDQLLFPAGSLSHYTSDTDLLNALDEVSLGNLSGNLYTTCDWSDILSAGEQQRVAFARLFMHQPEMAYLDEASSALDQENESKLYSLLREKIVSYVSVGHRKSLVQYHTHVLEFTDEHGWRSHTRLEFEGKGLNLHSQIQRSN